MHIQNPYRFEARIGARFPTARAGLPGKTARGLFAAIMLMSLLAAATPAGADTGDRQSLVKRGHYLTIAGDCAACHTADNGAAFAGAKPLETPFGIIYSANITPDPKTGIGNWSEQDFYNAVHDGMAPGWTYLYPAFPYTSFTHVTKADVHAIYAYLKTLKPVHRGKPDNELPWPLSWRISLFGWRVLFFDFRKGTYEPDPHHSKTWNRGNYLVHGLGHCVTCHTPRNALGAAKSGRMLAGGPVRGWYAANITSDPTHGLGKWRIDEITEFLKTGEAIGKTAAMGPMSEVIHDSLQYLTDADLHAIAVYLKSVPAKASEKPPGIGASSELNVKTADLSAEGTSVYKDNCARCHQPSGQGIDGAYPPLAGNPMVVANDPANAIKMVLQGGFKTATESEPMPYSMPPFAHQISPRKIAAVISYIRGAWGNNASPVVTQQIRTQGQ